MTGIHTEYPVGDAVAVPHMIRPAVGDGRTDPDRREDESPFVYAIGRIEPHLPDFAVLTIRGCERYLLHPRDPIGLDRLREAMRPTRGRGNIDVVIGVRGPTKASARRHGLKLPIVAFDQIYSLDRTALVRVMPGAEKTVTAAFRAGAEALVDRVIEMSGNAGATDAHRALNYLATRYPAIYQLAADAFARRTTLADITVRPSTLNATRNVQDVIFSFANRSGEVTERAFVRVDVSDEFPFLVTKLSPYKES